MRNFTSIQLQRKKGLDRRKVPKVIQGHFYNIDVCRYPLCPIVSIEAGMFPRFFSFYLLLWILKNTFNQGHSH